MKVRATQPCYYNHKRYYPFDANKKRAGEVFTLIDPSDFSEKYMEEVGENGKPVAKAKAPAAAAPKAKALPAHVGKAAHGKGHGKAPHKGAKHEPEPESALAEDSSGDADVI